MKLNLIKLIKNNKLVNINIIMEKEKDMERRIMMMDIILENLKIIKEMEKENLFGKMERFMKVIILII